MPTQVTPVMSSIDFSNNTSYTRGWKTLSRGQLTTIDRALRDWESYGNTRDNNFKQALLLNIMKQCKDWLTHRIDKTTSVASKRRPVVTRLAEQAFERLQYETFEKRKRTYRQLALSPHLFSKMPHLRGLQGTYAHERRLYLASGKQHPASGTYIGTFYDELAEPVGARDTKFTVGKVEITRQRVKDLRELGFDAITQHKSFKDLTAQEFQDIDRLYQLDHVRYLNKTDRMAYLIMIEDDGLLYSGFNQKFDCGNLFRIFWAMDQYGNLFSGDPGQIERKHLRINHPTLNAGKAVICAGELTVAQGKLKMIDNRSGHYTPTYENLFDAVTILRDAGADLSQTMVTCTDPDPSRPGSGKLRIRDWRIADSFLNKQSPDAVILEN